MVFQSYALYPHMDVFHNIGYGLKVRGVPREQIRERVQEVARVLELEALLHRKPRELSGGPAPARGARPGDGAEALALPHGRAAQQPRCQAARHDAK
jgi:ABC-type taurine transport system ATPase subunit